MMGDLETHPFSPVLPPQATHLILGTFPTHPRNRRFDAPYPGRATFFWRLLSDIYQHPFKNTHGAEAAKERIDLCYAKGIAISDMVQSCRRKISGSSKDSDLEVVGTRDIPALLKKYPTIQHIILTGSSGKVSAHQLFFEQMDEHHIFYEVQKSKPPINGQFTFEGKVYFTHSLYSPSGLNIGRYAQALAQYRTYLPE